MSLADLLPGQNAEAVRDHWWWRPGWHVGRRFYAFHITFAGNRKLQRLADTYRQSLNNVSTVTIVPNRWLHLTMQGVGFTDELPATAVDQLTQEAREEIAGLPAFEVEFGEIVVADEAIVMPAEPAEPLRQLRRVTRHAIGAVLGNDQVPEDAYRFRPHVSVAYITADGPAEPYLNAVRAVQPDPARVRIDHVDLIEMQRDDRMYEWTTVAALPLSRPS
jgi:2'-5' RNA ligase